MILIQASIEEALGRLTDITLHPRLGNALLIKDNILIAGDIGCKNDAYRPEEALSQEEAVEFHSWQVDQLYFGLGYADEC